MRYFAYGSNMLTARISCRCPGTKKIGRAWLSGYTLRFDKRGSDGSGKCAIHSTGNAGDLVHGVLFNIPESQVCYLDRAEGEGADYYRNLVHVEVSSAQFLSAETYLVKEAKIDHNPKPYDWYLDLVVTGAVMHELPEAYIDALRKVQTLPDPDLKRPGRLEALKQLAISARP
jgi:cation transport regulator ChaC